MNKENKVIKAMLELSDKFHEMEKSGVEFTDEEDDAWADLTMVIQSYVEDAS
jgi:hypothetical protein